MEMRKTVYCEYKFWNEYFFNNPSISIATDDDIKRIKLRFNLYSFVCKSNVKLDLSSFAFGEKVADDLQLRMLWKKSANGECGLDFTNEKEKFPYICELISDNMDDKKLNAIYLTSINKLQCSEKERLFGIIAINRQNINEKEYLFSDSGIAIKENDPNITNWDFLKKVQPNKCNSLIIVDNYLLSDTNDIDENLLSILNIILPEELSVPFNLSIFMMNKNDISVNGRFELIKKKLKDAKKKLDIKLTIYNVHDSNSFHDRVIISNYIWIGCGAGFDLFKKGHAKKLTTVNVVFPFLQSNMEWCDTAFCNLINSAKKIDNCAIRNEDTGYKNYWGDKENRLLNIF